MSFDGCQCHLNSVTEEKGKDLEIYYKKDYSTKKLINTSTIQLSMLFTNNLVIISIYRSNNYQISIDEILKYSIPKKLAIVCGDINVCYRENKPPWIQELNRLGFMQLVKQPTHLW